MDPLSLAASAVSLATFCIDVANYVSSVKNAPKSAERLAAQLSSLQLVLLQLDTFLRESTDKDKTFAETSALVQSTVICKDQLLKVKEKLEKVKTHAIHRLTFPLNENEIDRSINVLRGCAQTFHFSLTIDGCALMSKTAQSVAESLYMQLETSKKIVELTGQMVTMTDLAREAQRTCQTLSDILFTMSLPPVTAADVEKLSKGLQRLQVASQSEREANVLKWLAVPSLLTLRHNDIRAQRTPETGDWLLSGSTFQNWVNTKDENRAFVCFGGPGVGKTVLTSLIIDRLVKLSKDQATAVAWCYCDYRERSSLTPMAFAASILRQLSAQAKYFPQPVSDFYELFKNESPQNQAKHLMKTLISVCLTFSQCFVVVDALDEIGHKHRKEFLRTLKELQTAHIKIFVTSRPHIHDVFEKFSSDIQQPIQAHENDIKMFLTKSLADSDNMEGLLDTSLEEEIVETLLQNAHGMFLLPALQIQAVMEQVSKSGIRSVLRSLSSNLDEVFGGFIERIKIQPGTRQQVALATLTWLAYAKRSLSIDELRHALATRLNDVELDHDNMILPRIIVESCLGLLVIEQEHAAIRLVHFSLQEYLQSHRQDLFPHGDAMLAATCLTYSNFSPILYRFQKEQADLSSLVEDYPLLAYSCSHWGHHAAISMTPAIRGLAMTYLSEKARVVGTSRIADWGTGRIASPYERSVLHPAGNSLHCVSMFGLTELIPDLIRNGANIGEWNHRGNSPLHEAILFTQTETAVALLREGADFEQANFGWNTALFLASALRHTDLLELLLEYGANPNVRCRDYWSPLQKASDCGHLKAVSLLLDHGASLNQTSGKGLTALHRASGRGHFDVVQLLLLSGSRVNAQTLDGWTPLHGAASSGRTDVAQLLLRNGAEVNHMAKDQCTPLHRACQGGYLDTVRTLLQSGADRLKVDVKGEISLHKAAKGGQLPIVHLLLGDEPVVRAAQLECSNTDSQIPRDLALNAAHYDLSKLMAVNYQNSMFQSEVESMIRSGNSSKIEAVLRDGAIPDEPDGNGLTPFHQAISETQYEIASILLEHGADVDHAALNGWTPLHTACKRGDLDCVKLCIEHGAQIMSQDRYQRNPLQKACQGRNVDIVRLLIEHGADPAAVDSIGFTAMHICAEAGCEDIALFLFFEHHVSLESWSTYRLTPQAVAARAGHHALTEFFRAHR